MHCNALEFAFLPQDIEQDRGRRPGLGVARQVDDVIEVARPRPVGTLSRHTPQFNDLFDQWLKLTDETTEQ